MGTCEDRMSNIIDFTKFRQKIHRAEGLPSDPPRTKTKVPIIVCYCLVNKDPAESNKHATTWLCAHSFEEAREMIRERYQDIVGYTLQIDSVHYASDDA